MGHISPATFAQTVTIKSIPGDAFPARRVHDLDLENDVTIQLTAHPKAQMD